MYAEVLRQVKHPFVRKSSGIHYVYVLFGRGDNESVTVVRFELGVFLCFSFYRTIKTRSE